VLGLMPLFRTNTYKQFYPSHNAPISFATDSTIPGPHLKKLLPYLPWLGQKINSALAMTRRFTMAPGCGASAGSKKVRTEFSIVYETRGS
jgi:hypothetical protein